MKRFDFQLKNGDKYSIKAKNFECEYNSSLDFYNDQDVCIASFCEWSSVVERLDSDIPYAPSESSEITSEAMKDAREVLVLLKKLSEKYPGSVKIPQEFLDAWK